MWCLLLQCFIMSGVMATGYSKQWQHMDDCLGDALFQYKVPQFFHLSNHFLGSSHVLCHKQLWYYNLIEISEKYLFRSSNVIYNWPLTIPTPSPLWVGVHVWKPLHLHWVCGCNPTLVESHSQCSYNDNYNIPFPILCLNNVINVKSNLGTIILWELKYYK